MEMQMSDGLSAVLAAIIDNTVAVFQAFLLGDLGDRLENTGYEVAVFGIYAIGTFDMLFGNYHRMERSLRCNIGERINIVVLEYLGRRHLTCRYLTKKAVHLSHLT